MSSTGKNRVRKAAPDRTVSRPAGEVLPFGGYAAPHSAELERRVIAAVLDPVITDAWALAEKAKIKAKAFYVPGNGLIWQVIADMKAAGLVVTIESLTDELRMTGIFESAGGFPALMAFGQTPTTSITFRQDCERLRLLWEMRQALDYADQVRGLVMNFEDREGFAEKLSEIGQRFIRFGRSEASMTLVEHIEEVERDIEKRIAGKEDRSRWVFTGLPTFDKRLKPLNSTKNDGLVVLGGGSGHGKSALARQWTWRCLKDGGSVIFYTLETDTESFIEQVAAAATLVDLEKLPDYAALYPDRMLAFRAECKWLREIADKHLWVVQHGDGTKMRTVEDLERHYLAHSNLHGHPKMVVVDYLQILETEKRTQSREQTVATVSHALQRLCLAAGNCWLVPAQLNEDGLKSMRLPARDKDGRIIKHNIPHAGALRESQAIYHDGARVIMLYCPPEDCRGNDNWGANTLHPEIWLCQIKRKKGATGWVKCWFDKRHTHFRELSREEVIQGETGAVPAGAPESPPNGYGQPVRPRTKSDFLNQDRRPS